MTPKTAPPGDPVTRAFAAWFRAGNTDQPSNLSAVTTHEDKQYVVLANVDGVLAVYRVTNFGQLKRLKRWPSEVEDGFR